MIKCINDNGYKNLTLNNEYKVKCWNEDRFYFYDDSGSMSLRGYPKTLFKYDKKEYDEIK